MLQQRVEPPRTPEDFMYDDDYNVHRRPPSSSLQLIEKNLLVNLNRNYTHLKVEWRREPNMGALKEVLTVCLERFPVQTLYFKASLGKTLADLLSSQRNLLQNLTELCLEQGDTSYEQSANGSVILELSLPNLRQLTWLECGRSPNFSTNYYHPLEVPMQHTNLQDLDYQVQLLDAVFQEHYCVHPYSSHHVKNSNKLVVTLHVPELDRLEIRAKSRRDANRTVYLGMEHANQCCLFLPCLNLKSCSNLQHLEISQLSDLDQSIIDHSASVLQNMKSLTLFNCNSQVVEKLCGKCPKLQEMNIHSTSGRASQELFSVFPQSLQKLSLKNFPISFSDDSVVLPELRYIRLVNITAGDNRNKLSLNAPKLATIATSQKTYNLLKIVHKNQIRTMVIEWNRSDSIDSLPPPNESELFLCLKVDCDDEHETLRDYLKHFPNLRRLTVFGKQGPTQDGEIELSLTSLPNLEYLYADGVTLRLTDFHELKHLKSLILSDCILKSNQDDAQIVLQELQYFRARLVVIVDAEAEDETCGDDRTRNLFPIDGRNVRHPPVVKLSTRIFSTPGYQPKQWNQLVPTK